MGSRHTLVRRLPAALIVASIACALALFGPASHTPAVAQGRAVQTGVAYGPEPDQTMDVYLPPGDGPFPAVVTIHGGVFVKGTSNAMRNASEEAVAHGYAAFSLNYRLAPKYRWPIGFHDVQAAVVFIRQHASEFHVDPVRVGAIGGSAGANFAGLLATEGSGPPVGPRVVAAVLWSCPCDLHPFSHPVSNYIGPNATDEQIRAASPVFQVDPTDAPVLIANGTNEGIPFSEAEGMANAYKNAGLTYELIHDPHQAHSEHLGQYIYPQTFSFLDKYVKNYQPAPNAPPATETTAPIPSTGPTGSGPVAPPSSSEPANPRCERHPRRCQAASPAATGGSSLTPVVAILAGTGAVIIIVVAVLWALRRQRSRIPPPPPPT